MKAYVGERITMRFRVENRDGKDFTISSGDYTVMLGESVMSAGQLTIEGHEVAFLFAPEKAGIHKIMIWYDVGPDRRKSEFSVEVVA